MAGGILYCRLVTKRRVFRSVVVYRISRRGTLRQGSDADHQSHVDPQNRHLGDLPPSADCRHIARGLPSSGPDCSNVQALGSREHVSHVAARLAGKATAQFVRQLSCRLVRRGRCGDEVERLALRTFQQHAKPSARAHA